MNKIAVLAVLVCSISLLALPVFAGKAVMNISWSQLESQGKLAAGKVVSRDGMEMLEVSNPGGEAASINILTLDNPNITLPTYAVAGKVAYEGVENTGYLEMWNDFGDKGCYFTRTLAQTGPMGYLSGSSKVRPFLLPFFSEESYGSPKKLILNVALPGKGTVYIGPLQLSQYSKNSELVLGVSPCSINFEGASASAGAPGAWWDQRTGTLMGASIGTFIGLLGGLLGTLIPLGRGRSFVLATLTGMAIFGGAMLASGLIATGIGQPMHVWYPLVLIGSVCLFVTIFVLPTARRRYNEIEIRRMSAQDAV